MANKHDTLNSLFTDIADAIREKTGSTEQIVADDFPEKIKELPTGGSSVAGTLCHSKTFESVMGWSLVPAVFNMEHSQ